jgi:hypothetical protein
MYGQSHPHFQNQEERRLITLDSMNALLRLHETERHEKAMAIQLYSIFIGAGMALVFGIQAKTVTSEIALLKLISITTILTLNFLMIKKLLAVRAASNNIYREYGRRLRYLMKLYSKDQTIRERKRMNLAFQRYYGDPPRKSKRLILAKYSADKYEIFGLWMINCLFSLTYVIPLVTLSRNSGWLTNKSVLLQLQKPSNGIIGILFLLVIIIVLMLIIGNYIITTSETKAPGTKNRSP